MENKENLSLIDSDTFIYIATYNKKDKPKRNIQEMFDVCDTLLQGILIKTNSTKYCGFLTEGKCFRNSIGKQKEYKGNRKDFVKPDYFNLIKYYLIDELKFVHLYNYEADDLCIMAHNNYKELYNPIICSCDKDLKQIEANFYDYKKDILFSISRDEALYNLYSQILTGDVSDNINGLGRGIGPAKALKILEDSKPQDYKYKVLEAFISLYGEYNGIVNFTENYRLCKMLDLTLDGELYSPTIHDYKKKEESIDEILGW